MYYINRDWEKQLSEVLKKIHATLEIRYNVRRLPHMLQTRAAHCGGLFVPKDPSTPPSKIQALAVVLLGFSGLNIIQSLDSVQLRDVCA
ncbi:hypothetical protein PROFUN_06514 [Planoprotostelium fungivorum]|uniref:Uncharacterized protein n=1 Tax=Planoprotostelium fungivorum TaxID=1890364 RepID=A0A2P6NP00_9EUKA|nr:hypothetical protein PROFUN_06514 [Planoprotostelium fungivorum]